MTAAVRSYGGRRIMRAATAESPFDGRRHTTITTKKQNRISVKCIRYYNKESYILQISFACIAERMITKRSRARKKGYKNYVLITVGTLFTGEKRKGRKQ